MSRFLGILVTALLFLFAAEAGAVCIYNTTGYTVDFKQNHGHKKAMTAKLPPNTHSCRKWNHPTLNAKRTKDATLRFYVSFYDKSLEKSRKQRKTELEGIWRSARRGLPVQPITELPPTRTVCNQTVSASGAITITGRPGQWNCLVSRSEAMHQEAQGGSREPELPQSMGDCNKHYHQCAGASRQCRQQPCPTLSQCQAEYDDCTAYLQSQAPPPAYLEPELIEPETIYWGAAASHDDTPYFAWDYESARAASSSALDYCRKQHPRSPDKCQSEISFRDCAASAYPHHGNQVYWVEAASLRQAKREVDAYCREETGDSCHVNWSFCSNGEGGANNKLLFYGSIAKTTSGKGRPVLLTNRHFPDDARLHALRDCEAKSRLSCREVVNFVTCAAYAESKDRAYFGWSRNESLQRAKNIALNNCKKLSGQRCQVTLSACNKGF